MSKIESFDPGNVSVNLLLSNRQLPSDIFRMSFGKGPGSITNQLSDPLEGHVI